jgi:NADH-quinone oxidoreductase subunit H
MTLDPQALVELLWFLVAVVVFPGLLFTFLAALLNQWYTRKIFAKMQNRIGPKYVGLSGVLQPFYDFFKLFSKESITPKFGRARLYVLFIGISIGSSISTLLFLPISPFIIHSSFDVIIFIYLGLWSSVALAIAALMFPNMFSTIGASRLVTLMFVFEPTWVISLLTPVVLISKSSGLLSFSVAETIENFSVIGSNPIYLALTLVALATAIASLQCKLGLQPFDIFEADSEILAGVFTEFSGIKLALASLFHDIEMFVGAFVVVFLFLGGAFPFSLNLGQFPLDTLAAILLIIVKFLLVVLVLVTVKASSARYRIDQAVSFFFKYPLLVALAALIIATVI